MNDIALVKAFDQKSLQADVMVYPASCGRCDGEGNCTRKHREMTVQVRPGIIVAPGEYVRLEPAPGALWRGVKLLFLLPGVVGGAGYIGAVRLGMHSPVGEALAVVGAAIPVILGILRGTRAEDRPVIVERLAGVGPGQPFVTPS